VAKRLVSKVENPALPIPPTGTPLRRYLDDLNNILRLFFNRLANNVNLLTGEYGGQFIEKPNGLFFSTTDQPIAAINTAQVISFENTYLSEAITINGGSNSQITATYSGIYNFQFVAQAASGSASSKNVYVWIRRNGTDIGYSARHLVLQGSNDSNDIAWAFNIDLQAGQYIEMMWSADDINTRLDTEAAAAPHPGEPSAILTATFVSTLPETLPTPP
jgi:hypothetical protein